MAVQHCPLVSTEPADVDEDAGERPLGAAMPSHLPGVVLAAGASLTLGAVVGP